MKLFIKKTFAFSSILVFNILIFITVIFNLLSKQADNIKINNNINTIILGDSHTKCAINDSILPNALNISISSEPFLYSYLKLKRILEANNQIENVYIGVSFHSFSTYWNKSTFDLGKTNVKYPRYFSVFSTKELLYYIRKNAIGMFLTLPEILKQNKYLLLNKNPLLSEYPFIGKFNKSDGSKLNDTTINAAISIHYFDVNGEQQKSSQIQREYISRIIELSKEYKISLYLINTPIHSKYKDDIPIFFINNYYKTIDELIKKTNVQLIDYTDLKLSPKCYYDGDHLNKYGAEILTHLLIKTE